MGLGSYIMVLIGCTQASECAPIVTLPAAYRDQAGCIAASAEIVAASSGLGFDRVFAECRTRPNLRRTSAPSRPTA